MAFAYYITCCCPRIEKNKSSESCLFFSLPISPVVSFVKRNKTYSGGPILFKCNVTVVPWPTLLSISSRYPYASRILCTMESPKPVPRALVVKNGSKTLCCSSVGMPFPLSEIIIFTKFLFSVFELFDAAKMKQKKESIVRKCNSVLIGGNPYFGEILNVVMFWVSKNGIYSLLFFSQLPGVVPSAFLK